MTILRDVSVMWSLIHTLLMFMFLFDSRYSKKKTIKLTFLTMLPLILLNFILFLVCGSEGYMQRMLITLSLPSLIFFFILAKHRDGRFFFTFCVIDTLVLEIIYITNIIDHYIPGYWFMFTRVIDGVKTCDDIKIFISSYGEIYAYHALMLGTMKNVDISNLNFAELESAVEKKLKTIYSKYPDMKYNSDSVVLTRLADGSFAFEYDANVVVNKAGEEYSETCCFVIKLD